MKQPRFYQLWVRGTTTNTQDLEEEVSMELIMLQNDGNEIIKVDYYQETRKYGHFAVISYKYQEPKSKGNDPQQMVEEYDSTRDQFLTIARKYLGIFSPLSSEDEEEGVRKVIEILTKQQNFEL